MKYIKGLQINFEKINWIFVIALYVLQIVIFQIMVNFTFPVIQENLGDLKMFDMMKQGYDVATANEILANIGEKGRQIYLFVQMPLDFIYPCIMAGVYYLVLVKTSSTFRYSYFFFPMVLVLFDWMENICIISMLNSINISQGIVTWCNICTRVKVIVGDYILYFAAIISIIAFVSKWIIKKIHKIKTT